jgi:hypothetical protein
MGLENMLGERNQLQNVNMQRRRKNFSWIVRGKKRMGNAY